MGLFFMIFLVFLVLMIINTTIKKKKITALSSEEKEMLNGTIEKVKEYRRKLNLSKIVLNIIGIVIISLVIIYGMVEIHKVNEYNKSIGIIDFSYRNFLTSITNTIVCYMIIYCIIRLISYKVFLYKICKDDNLIDKEKALLKLYYGKQVIPIIFYTLLIQMIVVIIKLINTSPIYF